VNVIIFHRKHAECVCGIVHLEDFLLHLAVAALDAISLSLFLLSFLALAFPPFNPPSLPSATAAGFFSGVAGGDMVPFNDC